MLPMRPPGTSQEPRLPLGCCRDSPLLPDIGISLQEVKRAAQQWTSFCTDAVAPYVSALILRAASVRRVDPPDGDEDVAAGPGEDSHGTSPIAVRRISSDRIHTGVVWTSCTALAQRHPMDRAYFPMAWGPPWDAIAQYDDEGLPIPWLSPEEVRLNEEMDAAEAAADAEACDYRCNQCGQNLYGCFCPNRV